MEVERKRKGGRKEQMLDSGYEWNGKEPSPHERMERERMRGRKKGYVLVGWIEKNKERGWKEGEWG